MPEAFTLSNLLARFEEPTVSLYKAVTASVIERPEQITKASSENLEETLDNLRTRNHRLVRLFAGLYDFQTHHVDSPATRKVADKIATAATTFLLSVYQSFVEEVGLPQSMSLLVAAITVCLTPNPPSSLRAFARELSQHDIQLRHLACDNDGGKLVSEWVHSPLFNQQDADTLAAWASTLNSIAAACPDQHGAALIIQEWEVLRATKTALQDLSRRLAEQSSHIVRDIRRSGKPLESTKGLEVAAPVSKSSKFSKLNTNDSLCKWLKQLGLSLPESERGLANIIGTIEGAKTHSILKRIAITFPCSLCQRTSHSTQPLGQLDLHLVTSQSVLGDRQELGQFLGNVIGDWKVSLSAPALKSIQKYFHLNGAIPKSLLDLTSGIWDFQSAGSEQQRKVLKTGLAQTKCGNNLFILWQVDIDERRQNQPAKQIIKVWAVGKEAELDRAINRVVLIQQDYARLHVQQCRKRPLGSKKKWLPNLFDHDLSANGTILQNAGKLDVASVDPKTVDMANKFYALTKPVVRAIITNNLTAEFPFDVSSTEYEIINHIDTASLILGRSGTGKTTCLIFKMIAKYLARKSILDERPIRQILLTRSVFLADKLRNYSTRLIEGQTSQALNLQALDVAEGEDWTCTSEPTIKKDALTLGDEMFPLVITFVQFLQLLENTMRALDRKSFDQSDGDREEHLVTLQAFCLDYWPRFPSNLTRHQSPHLIFPEILGVIKGSVSSTKTLRPLSLDQYLELSPKVAPSFPTQSERRVVFKIYHNYESLRTTRGDFDLVDRVVRLVDAIRRIPNLKRTLEAAFHEVYVDEVQDHQCIDFSLFLTFTTDGRGIHCAGDTAQAISQDSTFRFNDPKGLFYEHFAAASKATGQVDLCRPKLFTLNRNYRSHQGILAVASFVMDLLWKGFPETIDRLDPEIGRLSGPKPVLFLNCNASTFISGKKDDVQFSKRHAEFGAEQVILVRDEAMKERLKEQFGDSALILTILQSKGMEFEDVVLWKFFSGADVVTVARKLRSLFQDPKAFDSKKNWSLCSELKHLYVAVTRARMQLFLVEGTEEDTTALISLLTKDVPQPLVEVTQPGQATFPDKVMSMLPGDTVDPLKWALRGEQLMQLINYKDAAMCFRKAGNRKAETLALAKLHEEKARKCSAGGDSKGFAEHLEVAINHFTHADRLADAAKCLVRMSQYSRAAKLWLKHRNLANAAAMFVRATAYRKAAFCFRVLGRHEEAATALRDGNEYSVLVPYLACNLDQFSAATLKPFARLCKLLLKQEKIDPAHRKDAIAVLGTTEEQEAAFIEYEMTDDLTNLYLRQGHYSKAFEILLKKRALAEALETGLIGYQSATHSVTPHETLNQLLSFLCAEQFHCQSRPFKLSIPQGITSRIDGYMQLQYEYWGKWCNQATYSECEDEIQVTSFETLVWAVEVLLHHDVQSKTIEINAAFLKLSQTVILLVDTLALHEDSLIWDSLFIILGIWRIDNEMSTLPWSPLGELLSGVDSVAIPSVIKFWAVDKLSSFVVWLNAKARVHLGPKRPAYCLQFLTSGFCAKNNAEKSCERMHETVKVSERISMMNCVMALTKIFCTLNHLFARKFLTTTLLRDFLGIRRYWLERLLRELTWVTSFEQDARLIRQTQSTLINDGNFNTVRSCLEELLYRRLGTEWDPKTSYTSMLEHLQMAKFFNRSVQTRHFQSISARVSDGSQNESRQTHLKCLRCLEWEPEAWKPADLKNILIEFLRIQSSIEFQELEAMHTITSLFEHLTLYFIIKSSPVGFVVPEAWLDLYLSRLSISALPLGDAGSADTHTYHEMLNIIIHGFCDLMARLEAHIFGSEFRLKCSGRRMMPPLMQQRNVDLLVIGVVNLHASASLSMEYARASIAILDFDSVQATHLKYRSVEELRDRFLAPSFCNHAGKSPLVVILKNKESPLHFKALMKQEGVTTTTFEAVRSGMRQATIPETQMHIEPPKNNDIQPEKFAPDEIAAICRLQRRWRCLKPKIEKRRLWLQTPQGHLVARFIELGSKYPMSFPVPHPMRVQLVGNGIDSYNIVTSTRRNFDVTHQMAMSKVRAIQASNPFYETLDELVHILRSLGTDIKHAESTMTDTHLQPLVDAGDVTVIQDVFTQVLAVCAKTNYRAEKIKATLFHMAKGDDASTKEIAGLMDELRRGDVNSLGSSGV